MARRVRAPTLILQGTTDRQVSADQANTLAAAMRAAGNRRVVVRSFAQMNHLMLEDPSGDPRGYAALPSMRVRRDMLGALVDWLYARCDRAVRASIARNSHVARRAHGEKSFDAGRKRRIVRGKNANSQRENAAIPYCAPKSGLYLAPRRTAFLSEREPVHHPRRKAWPRKRLRRRRAKKSAKKSSAKKGAAKKGGAKKAAKSGAKKSAKKAAKRTPNAAFMKAMTPSAQLGTVVGSAPLPRTEVTKKLWQYIKRKGLQDAKNRRQINADENLKPIFGGKSSVSMFEMTKLVNKHLK
jgi:hypothetical protein